MSRRGSPPLRPLSFLLIAGALALPAALRAQTYPTYTVNTQVDDHDANLANGVCDIPGGGCSIRAAFEQNEYSKQKATIRIPEEYYPISLGPITVKTDVTVEGDGASLTRIDFMQGQGFNLHGASPYDVRMSDLEVYNAFSSIVSGTGGSGSAFSISSSAVTVLYRVAISNCSTDWQAGAIANQGRLTIIESKLTGNKVPLANNSGVTGQGGGIVNGYGGYLGIYRTTITGGEGCVGGAILNSGEMDMVNCTIYNNRVTYQGGGIYNGTGDGNKWAEARISYSTITGNKTGSPFPQGAPWPYNRGGGGIHNAGHLQMGNTIVAGNTSSDINEPLKDGHSDDCWSRIHDGFYYDPLTGLPVPTVISPTFTSKFSNMVGKVDWHSCVISGSDFDRNGTPENPKDPMLKNASTNGGLGETREPDYYSEVVGHGPGNSSEPFFACPATDQRGVPRPAPGNPANESCDIGAVEWAPATPGIDAESAPRTGNWAEVNDMTAGNYKYVAAPQGSGNFDAAPNEAHKLTFRFYADDNTWYVIHGSVRGPSANDNSFWVRVDGNPAKTFLWDIPVSGTAWVGSFVNHRGSGQEGNPEVSRVVEYLFKGMHTIEVFVREDGAQLDGLELVKQTSAGNYDYESEAQFALSGAFMVGSDPQAANAKFIYPPPGSGNRLTAPDDAQKAVTTFNVAQAGTYLLKGKVSAEMDDHNSFWVKVDGQAVPYIWDMSETNADFKTDYLSHRGNGTSLNPEQDPVELNLSAGVHTVEVFVREDGTKLDNLSLVKLTDEEARVISLNKPASSSSNENSTLAAAKAFDGNDNTRWASQVGDNQWLKVDLQGTYDVDRVMLDWEAAYASTYEIQISNDGENWSTLYHREGNDGGIDNLPVKGRGRYVRLLGIQRATAYGYSLYGFSVYGQAAPASPVNLAQGKTVTASSAQSSEYAASKAVDGNASTRWSSAFSNDQWIYVDLGAVKNFRRVKLDWEGAYGKGYEIKVSNDAQNWTDLFVTANGNGGTDDLAVTGRGRYVKMRGLVRGTAYGYSLYEFSVFAE